MLSILAVIHDIVAGALLLGCAAVLLAAVYVIS
jgi:hypothetical protein